jgi:hypothetical protein
MVLIPTRNYLLTSFNSLRNKVVTVISIFGKLQVITLYKRLVYNYKYWYLKVDYWWLRVTGANCKAKSWQH